MSKVSKELAHLAAKRLNPSEFLEYSNKIAHLVDMKPYKSTKNAKKPQTTVKTPISVDSEASDAQFREKLLSEWGLRPTTSVPNPNEAFRHRKRTLSRISNELEYLSREEGLDGE